MALAVTPFCLHLKINNNSNKNNSKNNCKITSLSAFSSRPFWTVDKKRKRKWRKEKKESKKRNKVIGSESRPPNKLNRPPYQRHKHQPAPTRPPTLGKSSLFSESAILCHFTFAFIAIVIVTVIFIITIVPLLAAI